MGVLLCVVETEQKCIPCRLWLRISVQLKYCGGQCSVLVFEYFFKFNIIAFKITI